MLTLRSILCLLGFIVVLIGDAANAQVTMRIASVTAQIGDTVNVPISVKHFSNIGAISLKLRYAPSKAQFLGLTDTVSGVKFILNAANDVITLAWFDATGHMPMDLGTGTLLKLRMVYLGGVAAITFDKPKCEIANGNATVVPASFRDGGISPAKKKR
jgi:hypothetical protein